MEKDVSNMNEPSALAPTPHYREHEASSRDGVVMALLGVALTLIGIGVVVLPFLPDIQALSPFVGVPYGPAFRDH